MPSTLAVDKIKTLSGVAIGWPAADGAANTILGTDGAGQLSFRADSAGEVSKGADIVSADPLVITTGANYFICTGTTGFNDMTVGANRHFYLEFSGILTMTHNAGVLDLPSGAAIVTAVGDVGEFYSTAANVVTCVNYTRASGKAVVETADGVALDTAQNWTKGQSGQITAHASATSITIDLAASNNFSATLDHNATFANPTNAVPGQSGSIFLTQGSTGGTAAWAANWDWAAATAPTLTATAAAVDRIDYVVRTATSIHAVATLNLS